MLFTRSAHAAIRGYLYQAWLGVLRWLTLSDGEILFCEGDEDLDQLLLHGVVSEQVKHLAGKANIRDRPVADSLVAFLRTFVRRTECGEHRRFRFTTTASLRPQRYGAVDVLAAWSDQAARPALISELRTLLHPHLPDAVDWLDAEPARWGQFVDSVEWTFGAPETDDIRSTVLQRLTTIAPGVPPGLLADRLLATLFQHSAWSDPGLRMLQQSDLKGVVSASQGELESWARTYEALNVGELSKVFSSVLKEHDRARDAMRLSEVLRAGTEVLPEDPKPADLLRAGSEVIPFLGQNEHMAALDEWLDLPASAGVCVLTGPAGAGKTRLAMHWTRTKALIGLRAGFLATNLAAEDFALLV